MHIQPGADDIPRDQAVVAQLLIDTLRRELGALGAEAMDLLSQLHEEGLTSYPGLWALAYRLQDQRQGAPSRRLEALHRLTREARRSQERARASGSEPWRLDLTPPARHLSESLERAVRQSPQRPGWEAALAEMALTEWREAQRQVFRATSHLLAAVWPEMLSELRLVIQQVALMRGGGIDGFTDFAVHGAVFVNIRRLSSVKVPPDLRLAEALIHEGCHTRCNAAAVVRPFLRDSSKDSPHVMTPLRPDPRPLTGLFQQLVVLCRCLGFYERVVGRGLGGEGTVARCDKLRQQARQAWGTLQAHAHELTDHGLGVVRQAGMQLEKSATQGASL
ncbi:aKG-HExxH-type peptide beta-hydroxylase [Melittangium boletus]|uniref:HEXXH motif domain-containing protein n=1 Tax=Melittangium boletus DSM 14713 TaxID=1294270 RepID=A0A250IRD3_9BACT|nr:HEXXH motif-containing putative peptide modification protein [Melittangium boletus]ATB33812.1 HEXXH motif domain-containing protein [Melittangium boletus DSM 14713]